MSSFETTDQGDARLRGRVFGNGLAHRFAPSAARRSISRAWRIDEARALCFGSASRSICARSGQVKGFLGVRAWCAEPGHDTTWPWWRQRSCRNGPGAAAEAAYENGGVVHGLNMNAEFLAHSSGSRANFPQNRFEAAWAYSPPRSGATVMVGQVATLRYGVPCVSVTGMPIWLPGLIA